MAIGDEGNVKWVDGFRGVASVLVVVKHIVAAWFGYLLWPAPAADAAPLPLQWPYFRVFIQGRIGVTIFCFVTGYVCALKPVKLFVQDNHNQAYAAMTRSAMRRVPRLVLPVTIIICLTCIATQLGAFEVAKHCDGWGLPETSPTRRPTIFAAFNAMLQDMVRVWSHSESEYGSELWTMQPILKGAFWVYVFLVATARVQQRWRMAAALIMTLYRWAANDPYFGMQFFFGAFVADLQNLDPSTFSRLQALSTRPLRLAISISCIVIGLGVGSLPDRNIEWQPWSTALRDFLAAILPRDPHLPRSSSGLGLDIIVIGLHFSSWARTVLSNRFFLWLGRMSFAVYMLHNQILRSVLCWMLYGFAIPDDPDERLVFDSPLRLFMLLPVYFGLVYGSAYLWTTYVDSWCARIAERIVAAVKEDADEKPTDGHLLPMR